MTDRDFKPGDKVLYQFTHWLNSRSATQRVKEGVFIREVESRLTSYASVRKCVVKLEGNKNNSVVPLHQIRKSA